VSNMPKIIYNERAATAAPTTTDTSLDTELADLEAEHRVAEERRVWVVRRINEIKRLQGKLPSRDQTKRICGHAE
jgi:hypothetical protein